MNTAQANVVEFQPTTKKPKKKQLYKGLWEMPNGKYKLDLRDQNGERFRMTWTSKKAAEANYKRIVYEIESETFVNPNAKHATVATFMDEVFLPNYTNPRTGKRPRTDYYRDHIKVLKPRFGHIPLSDHVPARVWRDASDGFKADRTTAGIGVRIGKNLSALGTVLNYAVRCGYITHNPLKTAGVVIPSASGAGRVIYFLKEEFRRLLEVSPAWLRPMQRLAVATGFRLKEVTGLRWSDVDFNAGRIWTNEDSKTGRVEAVRMGQNARAVLLEQQTLKRQWGHDCKYVFADEAGKDYHADYQKNIDGKRQPCRTNVCRAMRKACNAIGKPDASFHTLRHTTASWAVQAGVSIAVVRELMRHKTLEMTLVYSHLAPQQHEEAINAVDAALAQAQA